MSDSDDEFDREAEREKLREKYEQDKERREATERMSDLLLKGATMTNRHCGTCGSPIFRHEGQAFCPTCQEAVTESDQTGEQVQEQGQQARPQDQRAQEQGRRDAGPQRVGSDTTTASDDERRGSAGMDEMANRDTPTVDGDPDSDVRSAAASGPDRTRGASSSSGTPDASESAAHPGTGDMTPQDRPSAGVVDDADLATVQASLTRTLAELARQAEVTDDPGRKRDYLVAAKEAAETLRAVRQARR